MSREHPEFTMLGFARGRAWNTPTRIVVSLGLGFLLTAATLGGAWFYAHVMRPGGRYVRDEDILIAMLVGAVTYLAALGRIWRPTEAGAGRRAARLARPILLTLGIAVVTTLAGALIDEWVGPDEELLIAAAIFVAAAVAIMIWLPTIQRLLVGRAIVNVEGHVNVNCPQCGYSLIGLRELRCPECGRQFTIDELIRAQEYGVVRANPRNPPQAEASDARNAPATDDPVAPTPNAPRASAPDEPEAPPPRRAESADSVSGPNRLPPRRVPE